MRHRLATVALSLSFLAATPVLAQEDSETYGVGSPTVSAAEARDIAAFNGLVAISKIEFDDGLWKVAGRDRSDHRVEMSIDPRTGEIAQLERFD